MPNAKPTLEEVKPIPRSWLTTPPAPGPKDTWHFKSMPSYGRNRPDDERAAWLGYATLAALEPKLVPLLIDVMTRQPTTDEFYRSVKPVLLNLVGWGVIGTNKPDALKTESAYSCVYTVLYSFMYDPPEEDDL